MGIPTKYVKARCSCLELTIQRLGVMNYPVVHKVSASIIFCDQLHWILMSPQAGHLAMETLLSLTSKRAGEWFKEELRELGGVEHLVRTIKHCTQAFTPDLETWTRPLLEKMSKVDRCLKVLENVSLFIRCILQAYSFLLLHNTQTHFIINSLVFSLVFPFIHTLNVCIT